MNKLVNRLIFVLIAGKFKKKKRWYNNLYENYTFINLPCLLFSKLCLSMMTNWSIFLNEYVQRCSLSSSIIHIYRHILNNRWVKSLVSCFTPTYISKCLCSVIQHWFLTFSSLVNTFAFTRYSVHARKKRERDMKAITEQ